jgi:DNA replication protein DnaC
MKIIDLSTTSATNGILILGPQGSGKTTLAKAIAPHLKARIYDECLPGDIPKIIQGLKKNSRCIVVIQDDDSRLYQKYKDLFTVVGPLPRCTWGSKNQLTNCKN